MKRCLTLILVLTLALSCAAVPAFAYAVGSEEPQHTLSMLVQESPSSSYLKNGLADYEGYPVWQAFEEMLVEAGIQLDIELISAEQYQVVVQTRMASATNVSTADGHDAARMDRKILNCFFPSQPPAGVCRMAALFFIPFLRKIFMSGTQWGYMRVQEAPGFRQKIRHKILPK